MEATDEEPGSQIAVTRQLPGLGESSPRTEARLPRCRRMRRMAPQHPGGGQRDQDDQRQHLHGIGPAQCDQQPPCHGRDRELPQRAPGIHHTTGQATPLDRHEPGGGCHQHCRARHAGPAGRQHADGEDEAGGGVHPGGQERADRHEHHARHEHPAGTDAISDGTGERLRQAPPQLSESKRQADLGHTQTGGRVQRTQEQRHGLAHAHGQREGAGCRQQHQPQQGARTCAAWLRHVTPPRQWLPASRTTDPCIGPPARAAQPPGPGPAGR